MKRLSGYILIALLLLFVHKPTYAQSSDVQEQLARYMELCSQCMALKSRAAEGENVSREEAKALIDAFLQQNKSLKAMETEMTVLQRHRFASIGKWFTTGIQPDDGWDELPRVVSSYLISQYDIKPVRRIGDSLNLKIASAEKIPSYRGNMYLMASMAAPDMAYGIMAGYKYKRLGGYVAFRSNYIFTNPSYICDSAGIIPGGAQIWPNGQQHRSNLFAGAGLLTALSDKVTVFAGAGYGCRSLAWQDVDGQWAEVSDWSHSGFSAECGAIISWRNMVFSAGISTVCFRTAALTIGVGFRL